MAEDPYATLGVPRDADEAAIRSAYRKLAKKYHPDLNPGDTAAEERFKAIAGAHDLLSDTEKRGRFDRGEIDADGQEKPERRYYRSHAEGQGGRRYAAGGASGGDYDMDDLGDILSGMFGARGRGGTGPRRGADRQYALSVPFLDAVRGTTQRLTLPDGNTLDVRIPPGIETGQVLRLKGKGDPGTGGAPVGDALIEVDVAPHRFFRRDGRDVSLDLPVSFAEAVLGTRVTVPTPSGPVTMAIPKGSDTGRQMRLRGKGVPEHGGHPAGDLYVTLRLVAGPADPALEAFLKDWTPAQPFDPRADLTGD